MDITLPIAETDDALENLAVKDAAPEPEEKPLSLRETIEKARDATREPEVKVEKTDKTEKKLPKIDKPRNESGKFVKTEDSHETQKQEIKVEEQKVEAIKAHPALGPQIDAVFKDLPPAVQAALNKRGEEIHKGMTENGEERQFAKQMKEVITPYMPIIKAEGGEPVKAVQELLNTAYLLRTASPQQKGQLIWQIARQFGADMSSTQQAQRQLDPVLQQVMQRQAELERQLQAEKESKKQQEDTAISQTIDAFKADPKNIHFETVKAHMAALLQSGLAKDLQDAYDQAVYANPQTRSALQEQQKLQSEEKRLAEQKARAEAAKKAGSSVKGAPGMGALKNGQIRQPDLRSELKAQFAAYRDG